MTRLVVTEQPPLPETIRIVEAAVVRALVWQPHRWVPETPADVTAALRDAIRNPRADWEDET